MKRSIRHFFSDNLLIKIGALGIAMILWLAGMNLNNPPTIEPFDVMLEIRNEGDLSDQNRILQNKQTLEETRVTVRLRATVLQLQNLDKSTIEAYIDLGLIENLTSSMGGKPMGTTIFIDAPFPYEVVGHYPNTVDVLIESKITVEKEVKVTVENRAMEGYDAITPPKVTPEKIKITGARSLVGTIDSVEVKVNVKDKNETFTENGAVLIYDVEGNDITNQLSLSHETVSVEVMVYQVSTIPIIFSEEFIGIPARGYMVTGIESSAKETIIIGTPANMALLKSIIIRPLSVDQATKDQFFEINLRDYLPPEIALVYGTESQIDVRITIEEQMEKEFEIPVSDIEITNELPEDFIFTWETEMITVRIIGAISQMKNVTAADISLSVTLEDLEPGTKELDVKVMIPAKTALLGEDIKLTIIIPMDEDEPEATTPLIGKEPTDFTERNLYSRRIK